MDFIKLNIKGISYSQTQVGAYALILEEEFGQRKLPIIIGNFEAQAIAIALEKDLLPPRPLTHDLFVNFAKAFQIEMKSVNIYKLEEGIFYSNIICENTDGEIKEIDSRTSDAIALAVRFNVPIYVLKEVMDRAGIQLEMISEDDADVNEAIKEIEKELNEDIAKEDDYSELSINELEDMMGEAAKNEDYETAAKLRDELDKRKENE
ncbi:hypothetical protein GO491_06205 [Flavobacteriaceae bacterium Ap0902]|nr:hypothetical protein [Flavobacteriaceae bacterium Ap0902]